MLFAERFKNIEVPDAARNRAGRLARALQARGVFVKIHDEVEGPTSRTYRITLGVGGKVSSLRRCLEDLSIQLEVPPLQLSFNENRLYLEVPRKDREFPKTRDIYRKVKTSEFKRGDFIVGVSSSSKIVRANLSSLPHLIVAGATGSGKSIALHNLLCGLMYTHDPKDLRLALVDPKRLELPVYNGLPHLGSPVVVEPDDAMGLLLELNYIMEQRYEKLAEMGLRDARDPRSDMPTILAVIDEFADFRTALGKEFEMQILRLAQKSRAAGIHLVLSTQRPSAKIITGDIKANFPARLALRTSSAVDSRVILGESGAEKLIGKGDSIFSSNCPKMRIQVPYSDETDVEMLKKHYEKL